MTPTTLPAIRVIKSEAIGEPYEDWSQVRSPSRAARRLRQGHPQNVRTRYRANGQVFHDKQRNVLYVHPADYPKVMEMLEAK